ncbi:MAG: geranylgeranyl reductase family protein [Bacteroidales bacterium]|nr:geranylgeranyl reductase family protein [Bacteroidales bacterium]
MSKSICIIGAGPGGAIAALTLAKAGIPCTVIDKAVFPREKICGDGFSGWVKVILDRLDPELTKELLSHAKLQSASGAKIVVPNGRSLDFVLPPEQSKNNGFTLQREFFDNFLIDKLRSHPQINLIEGVEISNLTKQEQGYELSDKSGEFKLFTALLIIANGAFSKFAKSVSGIRVSPKQNMVCARAYYKGVADIDKENPQLEFYFLKSTLPGYLWIFPEKEGLTNVGIGYFASDMIKKKMNPKLILPEILKNEPLLKDRFNKAEQLKPVQSCGLPMGHKKNNLAGDHFMIIGDAAVIANPLTGEGISAAMFSGSIAATHAIQCWENNDFSVKTTQGYKKELYKRLWWEITLSHKLQRLITIPGIMNLVGNKYHKSATFKSLLLSCTSNLKPARKIFNPYYLAKILLNK